MRCLGSLGTFDPHDHRVFRFTPTDDGHHEIALGGDPREEVFARFLEQGPASTPLDLLVGAAENGKSIRRRGCGELARDEPRQVVHRRRAFHRFQRRRSEAERTEGSAFGDAREIVALGAFEDSLQASDSVRRRPPSAARFEQQEGRARSAHQAAGVGQEDAGERVGVRCDFGSASPRVGPHAPIG